MLPTGLGAVTVSLTALTVDPASLRSPIADVLAIDRAGLVGEDGQTHMGLYDIAYMLAVPGMTVTAPKDGDELVGLLRTAMAHTRGPFCTRYPRDKTPVEPSDPVSVPEVRDLLLAARSILSGLIGLAGSFLVIPAFVLGIIALTISIVGIPALLAWVPLFPIAVVLSLALARASLPAYVAVTVAPLGGPGTARLAVATPLELVVALMLPPPLSEKVITRPAALWPVRSVSVALTVAEPPCGAAVSPV